MAVCNTTLFCVWHVLILMWIWTLEAGSDIQYQAEEEEIFHSDKQTTLEWTSDPPKKWSEIRLRVGTQRLVPVLQACVGTETRTILSQWMERKHANDLLMDIAFAQEEEPSGQLIPLKVHLVNSDTPITTLPRGWSALDLQTLRRFPETVSPHEISSHLKRSRALSLGPVQCRGFQIIFSYSGTCVLVTSIRLYYRRCPHIVANLTLFEGTGAGSGNLTGTCVKGAVEVSPPVRECKVDGIWGPLLGGCTCEPGHQVMGDTCQACRMGYHKAANESGGCRLCPPNSRTHEEGSERCDCLQGFSRLPTDPEDLGCTKPPSAPVNLTARHHNDSVLLMTWDPPHDWGGRQEVMYHVNCEKEAEARWRACGDDVVVLPDSVRLNGTSVSITGLNPQHNYRLLVKAWNNISTLQGGPPSSTATVTIHRCMQG